MISIKSESLDILVRSVEKEKPFNYIVQNLERTFGEPKLPLKSDALEMLIRVILSQATNDANRGGLANQKAKVIKNLLNQIKAKKGNLSFKLLKKCRIVKPATFYCNLVELVLKRLPALCFLPVTRRFFRSIRIFFVF